MDSNVFIESSPELSGYWEAAAVGKFLLPYCRSCQRRHWYPRGMCPHCYSLEVESREASGQGSVYAFTFTPPATSAIAYVTLDEGPTLLTRIVEAEPTKLYIGRRVLVVFHQVPGRIPAPFFKLV